MSTEPIASMPRAGRIHRRALLRGAAGLAAGAALGGLRLRSALALAAGANGAAVHAPLPAHFPPRATSLIMVYLTGGFSHLDTFDPKERLKKDHGKIVAAESLRETSQMPILASPFEFRPRGRSGLIVSELFPRLGDWADDLCVIRTLHTDIVEHFQGTLAMHTGSATVPLPSLGSWLSYGLGTFNPNLPPYVVLAEHLPYAGAQVWDSSFLPAEHQGVRIIPGERPVADLDPLPRPATLRQLEENMLRDVDRIHASLRPGDGRLVARSRSFDVARGMMVEAPEVFDLSREAPSTLEEYGVQRGDVKSVAWQCIIARRLVERGVRVVEVIDTGSHDNWDSHGNMQDHRPKAARVDRALGALIGDLKRRGLLDATLIMIATEFGRTPWANDAGGKGRNHWAKAFTCLLAGAGVRGGIAYGETDEYGATIARNPVHVHDYHATILHLLGIEHTMLTYRYAGRDFRLTDVSGRVVTEVLA
ncbi:MAG TPA: DUF1501 domain-containing protein [Planctomycetota bacterium]|nr:DUF1501 domain-containing protein [Planctomycetota bacterium]